MNKQLKTIISAAVFGGAAMISPSCSESYLDLSDQNKLTANTAWGTQAGVESGLTGAYHTLYNSFYTHFNAFLCAGQSDEFESASPDAELRNFINLSYSNYDQRWNINSYNYLYQAIFRANQVIVHADEVEWSSEAAKNSIVGQARALRGMHYYYLTMFYKKPPLVDWISSPSDQPAESTFEANCKFIEEDLKFAAGVLPESYPEVGRVNKFFALTFLGKLYMNSGEYAKAKDCFKQVIDSRRFSLVANYRDNFLPDTENNSESIFEIQNSDESSNKFGSYWGFGNDGAQVNFGQWRERFMSAGPMGYGDYIVSSWTIDLYKDETDKNGGYDIRLRDNIVYPELFTDFPGQSLYKGSFTAWEPSWLDHIWCRKYATDAYLNKQEAQNPNGINTRILRYADVLLSYAECMVQTDADVNEAAKYVDMVRERVNLYPLAESVHKDCLNDKEAFMRRLQKERCKEMMFEYDRYFDLRRWGLGTDAEFTEYVKSYSEKHRLNFVPGREWLPFPQTEVNNNPNLTQNESF